MDNFLNEFNLNEKQTKQFLDYFNFLIEENEKVNLTSITKLDEVYIKHFYDCLKNNQIIDFLNIKSMCDIGSGAGFPSIPLKIMYPHIELVIVEPIQKRTRFLSKLVEILDLNNVQIINGRAEDVIVDYREKFDLSIARAVANLPMLLELCTPFIKVNGYFVAMKGSNYQDEVNVAKNALTKLNCVIEDISVYDLPFNMGGRSLIKVKKTKKTSVNYPRKFSVIKKQTL